MTYDVEIMLRGNERVFSETLSHPRPEAEWSVADVIEVLRHALQSVDRVVSPDADAGRRAVSFRGMNWIVSPWKDEVVLAFEIHSASVVAGPFRMEADRLSGMVTQALADTAPSARVH